MTANKNEPDKKPASSASAQASARPHATLDLKATEVTPPAAKPEPGKAEPGKPEVAEASAKAKAAASSTAATPPTSEGGTAGAKPGPASANTATGAKDAKPAGAPPPSSAASRPAPRGYGGFFTHVAAGLAGGIVALLAADMLAQQLGFATADRPEQVTALEQRLAALESNGQGQRTIPPDVANRLTAAETKLGKLEQLDANVDGISKKQGQLDEDLNAIKDKIGTDSGETGSAARIAKLEEQLSLMSSAAESDPQSGRLPQLAAITGKLADLESTMANQLNALRRSVAAEFDTRLASAAEAGQTARSGTLRMDRELSTLKAESAEMSSGLTALKTDSDRAAASLKTTQEEIKRLKADLDTRLATFAKPEDVNTAVGPLSGKLAALQQDVQGVIKSEGDRRTTAERIVLSLELANLKRAIDRGNAYAPELEQARKVAGTNVDLAPLERFALEGVPTPTELRVQFKPIAFKIIDAEEQPADASIMDRLLAGASSVVRVRRTAHSPDDKGVEAIVARMETALNEDRLADVLQEANSLPAPAHDAAQDFLAKVQARDAVDRALASVETQLKASLAVAPADANGKAAE
ncbi:MAG: mitofilin family membrane protein [Hyphomicrobium sp.]|jgi:hypothetical protein